MPIITLLLTLYFSFLIPFRFLSFLFSLLSFTPFLTCFSLVLSLLISFPFLPFSPRYPYCAQLRPFLYYLSWWVFTILPLNCRCPGIGVLPKPPTGLSTAQPSPLTCASCATFHSLAKEFYFVFLLFVVFPFEWG